MRSPHSLAQTLIFLLARQNPTSDPALTFLAGTAHCRGGKVMSLDATVRIPYGTLTGCLKAEEFTPLSPGLLDYKFHCPDVGLVRGVAVVGPPRELQPDPNHPALMAGCLTSARKPRRS